MSDTGVKEMLRNFYEEFLMVTMKPRPSNMCGRTTGSTTGSGAGRAAFMEVCPEIPEEPNFI